MHKDRSHLYDCDMASVTSFHAYQRMIQDQILHENKGHDIHFLVLMKKAVPMTIHDKDDEQGCLYFGCHDDDDAAGIVT